MLAVDVLLMLLNMSASECTQMLGDETLDLL